MKNIYVIAIILSLLLASCGKIVKPDRQLGKLPSIFPDYTDVTIPCNIAPMDFQLNGADNLETQLIISGGNSSFQLKGDNGDFDIPIKKWKHLLDEQKGKDITFTVCYKDGGEWVAYKPFVMHVASDKIDPWLAYRLIPPGFGVWNAMGIYQRCLENFTEKPIMENKLTEYNCMNCHSFQSGNPKRMSLHLRGKHGGTVLCEDGSISKIDPKMPEGLKGIAYPYWHPTKNYIAYASDNVSQSFYANNPNRMEVYDTRSDIVVYDANTGIAHTAPYMSSPAVWETFPAFSADGKTLYWCAADTVASPYPLHYKDAHYSIIRTSFNAKNCSFGIKPDTLLKAGKGQSFTLPRESPDGKWLVYTQMGYGYFSINHSESDLHILNLKTGVSRPMTKANSRNVEGYHSWSRNSRWLVVASKRMNGVYTRPFFTYIDKNGNCTKAFLLPQRHPRHFYDDQLCSYNIPELITGEVKVNRHKIAKTMW